MSHLRERERAWEVVSWEWYHGPRKFYMDAQHVVTDSAREPEGSGEVQRRGSRESQFLFQCVHVVSNKYTGSIPCLKPGT